MESQDAKRKRGGLLWILVMVAVVLLWWYFRPADFEDESAEVDEIAVAQFGDPDDILVDLVDSATDADVATVEAAYGIDLVLVSDQSADERFYRAHVDAGQRDALLARLSSDPRVEVAEPDAEFFLGPEGEVFTAPADPLWEGYPDDPKFKFQWHMRQIHMPEAWKLADGEGVIVAVLDTGVAYEKFGAFHQVEDLSGVEFVLPYDFVDNDTHANDDHGHGTHVAGTIAQTTHNGVGVTGIARAVKIMPLKVLSGRGSGSVGGIADAIRYAADKGAKVINMSLGGPFPSKVLKNAVKYAHDKGVTVICAAGNDGTNRVGYPAAYPGAVAVSATQYDESITFYSNYGKHIDIAAPGGNTRVDQNGDGLPDGVLQNTIAIQDPTHSDYYGYMGTSMASPHAAGVAALIVGEGITNPAAVEKILKDSSRKPSGYTKDKYGAGLIDAQAAVLAARSQHGGLQFLLGLLLAGAVISSVRRRGLAALGVKMSAGVVGGVLVGASGLFFLPYLAPSLSSWTGIEMLTRGLPSLDMALFGPLAHGNALFFSALLPLALFAVAFSIPKLRGLLAGVALGVAAHLIFHAVTGLIDVRYMPDLFDQLWLLANAGISIAVAHVSLRK